MNPAEQGRAREVRRMFGAIAGSYDRMNRLMTAGMDQAWRRQVIRLAGVQAGQTVLDLGAGTGDLARDTLRQEPGSRVVAADFTLEMMLEGKKRPASPQEWSAADALALPFAANSFHALVSGFLLRNVTNLDQALREQFRVLRPGGRWVCLDTTRPGRSLLAPFIRFYMNRVIPLLGGLISGNRAAYTYLPQTSQAFLSAEELRGRVEAAGFRAVRFRRYNFGTIAIHWAQKPGDEQG